MTFLGIDAMVLRLPQEKLLALTRQLTAWKRRRWCRKSELQSLAGCLQHAYKVVQPGRTFLRRVLGFSIAITMSVSTMGCIQT